MSLGQRTHTTPMWVSSPSRSLYSYFPHVSAVLKLSAAYDEAIGTSRDLQGCEEVVESWLLCPWPPRHRRSPSPSLWLPTQSVYCPWWWLCPKLCVSISSMDDDLRIAGCGGLGPRGHRRMGDFVCGTLLFPRPRGFECLGQKTMMLQGMWHFEGSWQWLGYG